MNAKGRLVNGICHMSFEGRALAFLRFLLSIHLTQLKGELFLDMRRGYS